MRCVRIFFEKTGESKYISHLDLMRAMSRAVTRSKLPLWYTEGFNPHPYMSFALPLSLGMESICESMDIRLEGDMANEEVLKRLCAVTPPCIHITAVREPKLDPKAIAFGRFEVTLESENAEETAILVSQALSQGGLYAKKLSKQGHKKVMKEVDVSAQIRQFSVKVVEGRAVMELVLPAGSQMNLNPALVVDAIKEKQNLSFTAQIMRKQLLTKEMDVFE